MSPLNPFLFDCRWLDSPPDHQYSPLWHFLPSDNALFFPLQYATPPSPSDSLSSFSTDLSPSPPPPEFVHVVCNAPLVAPIPLPYHSPSFLQFDLLPDIDDDLSYPPYTHRRPTKPAKRKRIPDDDDPADVCFRKRRLQNLSTPLPPPAFSTQNRFSQSISTSRRHGHGPSAHGRQIRLSNYNLR